MFDRWYGTRLAKKLKRPFVHMLFGARQTGKSTLARALLPPDTWTVDLSNPEERSRYLADPGVFLRECRALPARRGGHFVFVDEAQAVPALFDAVQHLYDSDKTRWRFVLCGSSVRRLRLSGANLLPGRSLLHRLYPLTLTEHPADVALPGDSSSPLPFPWTDQKAPHRPFPPSDLMDHLAYGELPGIITARRSDRPDLLKAYSTVYLEEEIRREALVRDWGAFVRFLGLAAAESGGILNYAGISQETGISQPTVKTYYQLLEDMFVGLRIPAYSRSPRKNLLSTPRFLIFDLGVRHAAAGARPSPEAVKVNPGPFFEQWVGIELWKRLQYLGEGTLSHLRTQDGAEVDFIVERKGKLFPIEVKYTERPSPGDARHLLTFLNENPKRAVHGYVVCRGPRPQRLHDRITAIPWSSL